MNAVTEVMDELRKALAELEDCRARNADLRTMLEQVTRERDEALERANTLAINCESYFQDSCRMRKERDEARERLAGLPAWQHACEQSRLDLAEAEAVIARRDTQLDEAREACPDCAMWAERSARWHDDMQRAERERDEARADLARSVAAWESAGMQGRTAHDAMLALAKERDEARAEVERLKREVSDAQIALRAQEHRDQWLMAQSVGYGFYKRGAEAMREACACVVEDADDGVPLQCLADDLRERPIPEEP